MKRILGAVLISGLFVQTAVADFGASDALAVVGNLIPAINDMANNGPKIPVNANNLAAQLQKSKAKILDPNTGDLVTLKNLKPGIAGVTKEQQNEAMLHFLADVGEPFSNIADFLNSLYNDALKSTFKFFESIPQLAGFLQVTVTVKDPKTGQITTVKLPLSKFMEASFGAFKQYTDTYKQVMQSLPKLMATTPETGTAHGAAAVHDAAVDLGF